MAIKKSELYASLWSSCDELRGGMDASQYKDYILTLLFMKYVSDKYAGDPDGVVQVPPGGGFADMVAVKGDKEIGDKINKIIARLADANDLKGVVDQADFNEEDRLGRGQEMVERLTKLVAIFEGLDLSANRAEGDDLLGDAYEYLMRHFATESGKSKGQFYTPAEVSRIMAKVVGIGPGTRQHQTIYDPTCGSGSLLLKAADEAPNGMSIFGQEMDNATWALAKMNLILHGYPTAELWRGNTLAAPHYRNTNGDLKTYDFAVANPPFSTKAWTSGLNPANDDFRRFAYGIPPQKNGDYAFLLHLLTSLKSTGKGAIILPHGVLFRGGAEASIRREIVRRGFVKGIIGLPANLFYGTGIPACIIVLDKEQAATRTGIFMIDASKGFAKDGPKNRLRDQDIHKIVDVFTRQQETPRYARLVPLAEIEANDFNLNIPRYIDSSEPEDLHDLRAHLQGGIPDRDIDALAEYWEVLPSVRELLFEPARPGYSNLKLPIGEVKAAIFGHPEFTAFNQRITAIFEQWKAANEPRLRAIAIGDNPKELIAELSESLLAAFLGAPLVDAYDIYQHLMDYWAETMQDDVYLIVQSGWVESAKVRQLIPVKTRDGKETWKEAHDYNIGKLRYKSDLIPSDLLISRYLSPRQSEIDELSAKVALLEQQIEEQIEEHGVEGGLLYAVLDDKGNITKARINSRIKEIAFDADEAEERDALRQHVAWMDELAVEKKRLKSQVEALQMMVAKQYGALDESEIVLITVYDKWLAVLAETMQELLKRVSLALAGRVRKLGERYIDPYPQLSCEVSSLARLVDGHLLVLGAKWS